MSKRSERQRALLLMALSVLAFACGGDGGGTQPPPGGALTVSKTTTASGDAQSGTVGQPLANPVRVLVTENGSASSGVQVNWSTVPTGAGTMTPTSGATDADGVASSTWTLGTVSGAHSGRAAVTGANGSPVTFSATAAPDAAKTLSRGDGNGQSGEINTQLAAPVQAKVADQFGNGVPGVAVGWAATGATVSAATVATNATGISAVNVTLGGTAEPITITATAGTLTGSPLTFNATAVVTAPPPTSIAITVGNDFFRSDRNQTTSPAVDTVAVGGTVTWTWAPTALAHNATSNPPPGFNSSPLQGAGATYSVDFPTAGTYRYYCTIHASAASTSGMIGRIVVKP